MCWRLQPRVFWRLQHYVLEAATRPGQAPLEAKNVLFLQRVAMLTRAMSGGRVTMCKSGKDRTSMSVTLEHGRQPHAHAHCTCTLHVHIARAHSIARAHCTCTRAHAQCIRGRLLQDQHGMAEAQVARAVQTMRRRGVRRENVRLNTGRRLYAFNWVQQQALPDAYSPPEGSAAGGKA